MSNVRFENVSFSYGDNKIIDDLTLDISQGEIMGIIGPSGCGKTTLIRMLCGFISPSSGAIYIGDRCVFDKQKRINVPPEKRNIGIVFQDYAVWPHLTVMENVLYPLKKKKVSKNERNELALKYLKLVHMDQYADHLPSQLSGGQQQRVAIARALVSSQELIILDEPITNLDLKLREEMLREIRNIQKTLQTTIIYISHDQEASLQLCDQLAIMDNDGYIRQIGNDYEIVLEPVDRFVFDFIGVANYIDVKLENGVVYYNNQKIDNKKLTLANMIDGNYELGIRPTDISINQDETGIPGVVQSAIFLGNTTNYFVQIYDQIIRVQCSAISTLLDGLYKENDKVFLEFDAFNLFEKEKGVI